ncbi:SGNH/GDSL hydrolase family protein [Acetobacter sp. AN02]|uniref:SGNH/GDSL hydrolase family protein n=1 Tax=Acetobacter sp. AN02 TaxID=2894186 RepID=UPI00243450A4|nr:SGNH/GDSL hydrolase family protein [Acetobacter sp. AN02]MDG6094681.1 SGNH/GDSL hydrolase family protein [Acetobacter sp. AN02]
MSFPALSRAIRAGQVPKICLFGSSSMEGVGASSPEHAFAAVFERNFTPYAPAGVTIINRGIGGNDARDMHGRLQDVVEDHARLVIWQGGTNDGWHGLTADEFAELTRTDLQTLRDGGADIAMIGPQWCPMLEECPDFPPFLSIVPKIARELNIPYYDRYNAMKAWSRDHSMTCLEISPDQVHMGDFGYRLLGEEVAAWIGAGLGQDSHSS